MLGRRVNGPFDCNGGGGAPLRTLAALGAQPTGVAALYDRIAPRYDRAHRRWLRHAGGQAQAALEAAARAVATPQARLLDAGCGTGAFARALIAEGDAPARMTLLDPAPAMLARCADLPVRRVAGRLEALPFANASFDVVTCAWALETTPDLDLALRELRRVLRPGGALLLAFCADAPAGDATAWLMRQAVKWRGAGCFLRRDRVVRALRADGAFDVKPLPVSGPAAALLARRRAAV